MNYRESITAVIQGMQGLLENRTKTEAQAIALASTTPNTIYYTTDTNAVVIGGVVYGRGQLDVSATQVVNTTTPDSTWDTSKLVITYTGNGICGLFAYINSAWTNIGTLDLGVDLTAENISYDDTYTGLNETDVQGAIESISTELNGDSSYYWADMLREKGGIRACTYTGYGIRRTATGAFSPGDIYSTGGYEVLAFNVKEGEIWRLENLFNGTAYYAYAFYNVTTEDSGIFNQITTSSSAKYTDGRTYLAIAQSLHNYFISGAETPSGNVLNYSIDVTVPSGAKMMLVEYNFNLYPPGVVDGMNVYKYIQHNPISITDKAGMLITDWQPDSVIFNGTEAHELYRSVNSAEYAVGDTIGPLINDGNLKATGMNTNYCGHLGSRVVRLNVNEGDKLLLDTYSPIRYSMFFTDTSYVIQSLSEERRLDGVYTCPCTGYVYLIDVLYRENYLYSYAHGHLAYIAHDNRKNLIVKSDDWYNEVCPTLVEPIDVDFTPTSTAFTYVSPYHTTSTLQGTFKLLMANVTIGGNMAQTSGSLYISSSGVTLVYQPSISVADAVEQGTFWLGSIYIENAEYNICDVRVVLASGSANKRVNYTINKVFMHTFDNAADARYAMNKVLNGEVDVDNRYGVQTDGVNLMKNSAGLASVGTLGYDIVAKGADLPIDNDGVAYGITLKDTVGRTFNGTSSSDNADKNLAYLPVMDWSSFTGTNHYLFNGCENLITIPDIDWSSSLVFGNNVFGECNSLKKVGNLTPASCIGFSTFYNCFALESVGNIDLSWASTMGMMFYCCYSLKSIGTLSNTSRVTSLKQTFQMCTELESIPDLDTSSVTTMQHAFYGCSSLKYAPVLSDTSNVTTMMNMFCYCKSLPSLPSFNDTSNVTTFDSFAAGCASLISVGTIDISSATTIKGMFSGCNVLTSVGTLAVTSLCTSMESLFYNCYALESVGLSGDFSSITTAKQAFRSCNSLVSLSANLNLTSCTNMSYMFNACLAFTSIGSITTSAATDTSYMFYNCPLLTPLLALDFSNSTTGQYTFGLCTSLQTIALTNTAKMTNMQGMFYRDTSLIYVTGLDFTKVTNMASMFSYCTALEEVYITNLGASSLATYDFKGLTAWGTTPDGKDSLIYSLITNSVSHSGGKIQLSTNTYDSLTSDELASITAKKYTVTRG